MTSQKIILPFYHTVSYEVLSHVGSHYKVITPNQFNADLEFLCKHFVPISINELYSIVLEKKKVKKPVFHLSFDDGLKEIYTIIAPILKEKGIPASFFVNTAFIDNKSMFYRYKVNLLIETLKNNNCLEIRSFNDDNAITNNKQFFEYLLRCNYYDIKLIDDWGQRLNVDFDHFLNKNKPYLNSGEVKELLKMGFCIGSHSIDHPKFSTLSLDEQKRQIKQSFKFLKDNFGIADNYFSFPFTDYKVSNELINWMHNDAGCRLSFGTAGLKHEINYRHLQRIPMDNEKLDAKHILKKEYLYYALKSLLKKNTIHRN